MKIIALAACALLAGFAVPAHSQNAPNKPSSGILGRLDPKTGTFKLISEAPVENPEALASVAQTSGKFVANITIHIASTNLPANSPVQCSLSAVSFDVTSSQSNEESAAVTATRSGATATCSVAIPYSWALNNPAQDQVSLSYSVSTGSISGVARSGSHSLAPMKVPANGTVTTLNPSTTL